MTRVMEKTLAAAVFALAAAPAMADYSEDYDRGHYDYAEVVDVEPIFRTIEVSRPRQVCWDEIRYDNEDRFRRSNRVAGSAVLGGIIGAVIGHQIGSGRGNDVATVAGAAIGTAIGASRAARREQNGHDHRSRTVEHCETRFEFEEEEVLDGFRVTYDYNGREYVTRTDEDPGNTLRVRVSVIPIDS